MSRSRTIVTTAVCALVALAAVQATPAIAEDTELTEALRKVVADNVAAYDREDVDATLATVAKSSPDYDVMKVDLPEQFQALEVKPELVSFHLIGHDDEFAVGRARIKTTATPKSATFVDNTIDTILVFHQDGGLWKLWSEDILGVEVLP
jgi:hypothetical protein